MDQFTKLLITNQLDLGKSVSIVPGLLDLNHVRNTGMAFGLLSSADIPFKSILLTVLSLLAMGAVGFYALTAPASEKFTRVGLVMVLGGAAGNIVDRIRLGYVVDFIDVFYRGWHWPAFNVADSAICIGVGLLLLDSLWQRAPVNSSTNVNVAAASKNQRGDS